jgi:hypothetical protein
VFFNIVPKNSQDIFFGFLYLFFPVPIRKTISEPAGYMNKKQKHV